MIDQQTAQDLDRKVAEAFGYEVLKSSGSVAITTNNDWKEKGPIEIGSYYYYPNPQPDTTCYHLPKFHKDLSQITRYGVPWLMKKGYEVRFYLHPGKATMCTAYHRENVIVLEGQGEYHDNKMAWALSEVIVLVEEWESNGEGSTTQTKEVD